MNLKIVSTKRVEKVVEGVKELSLPTTTGAIQILPVHENLITKLVVGEITIVSGEENQTEKLFLSGGFAKVIDNEILILADEADLPDEIIKEQIEESIKNAEQKLSQKTLPPTELIQLEKQLMYERFKLKNLR